MMMVMIVRQQHGKNKYSGKREEHVAVAGLNEGKVR
jgi:hypothetical protein